MRSCVLFLIVIAFNYSAAYREEMILKPKEDDLLVFPPYPYLQNSEELNSGKDRLDILEGDRNKRSYTGIYPIPGARIVNENGDDGTLIRGYEDNYNSLLLSARKNGDFKFMHTVRF
ncbi:hypothetical protein Trydic_g4664 [Trypoxylus dichotomus]